MRVFDKENIKTLEKIRDAATQAAEKDTDLVWRSYLTGIATGIQIALHADLDKLLGKE